MADDIGFGGDGAEPAGAEPAVVYELDVEGAAPGAEPGAPSAPTPAARSSAEPEWATAIADIRRQQADTVAELTPWLAHLRAQQRAQQSAPPFRPEDLDTNPNLKPSDIIRYQEWRAEQLAQDIAARADFQARSTLSEQQARGRFSAAELGQGYDYDTLVNRYVAPIVQQNPAVDQLLQMAAPGDPATARMLFAVLIDSIGRHGDDVVKGIKGYLAGLNAYQQGARDTRSALGQAAQAAATRVLPGGPSAANAGARHKIATEEDVWRLSDRQFDRLWNQPGL